MWTCPLPVQRLLFTRGTGTRACPPDDVSRVVVGMVQDPLRHENLVLGVRHFAHEHREIVARPGWIFAAGRVVHTPLACRG